jgi:hypothetical protein
MMILVAVAAVLLAAGNAVVGTWKVVSDSPDGTQYNWTLVVKEEGGRLSGALTGSMGQFPLIEPRLEGDTFTCKVTVEETTYAIQSTITGDKFDGVWKGAASQGTIKGSKQP